MFNDEKKVGYNLISLSENLDISVKRVSPRNFLVLGINKDQETQGQASFCNLQPDGSVNEVTINFNYINQYKVIEQKYFLLNYVEVLGESDEEGLKLNKKYISTIAIYRQDGTILKVLFEETLNVRRDLFCTIDGDSLIIYYKDDNSVVKKESISSILLSQN